MRDMMPWTASDLFYSKTIQGAFIAAATLDRCVGSLWRVARCAFLGRDAKRAKVRCRDRYRNHREWSGLMLTIEWGGRAHVETAGRGIARHVEPESDMVGIDRRKYRGAVR